MTYSFLDFFLCLLLKYSIALKFESFIYSEDKLALLINHAIAEV